VKELAEIRAQSGSGGDAPSRSKEDVLVEEVLRRLAAKYVA